MLKFRIFAISLIFTTMSSVGFTADPIPEGSKPKYGPEAIPLSVSHEYFQKHEAPGFWAMIPYYLPQRTGSSCSVATVSMLVNAARAGMKLNAEDRLATETDLLKKVNQGAWKKSLLPNWHGVTLDEIQPLVEESLKSYGITPVKVEAVHVEDLSEQTRKKLHEALVGVGKSSREFILINFNQGVFTGDADVGHFAPIGAYDAEKKRVLVFDPDRDYYEPYWVSEETLLKGMSTRDQQSKKSRGYLLVKLPARR